VIAFGLRFFPKLSGRFKPLNSKKKVFKEEEKKKRKGISSLGGVFSCEMRLGKVF